MTKELKNDILYWISIGWNYQIIHKITFRKYGYDLSRTELKSAISQLALANAMKVTSI